MAKMSRPFTLVPMRNHGVQGISIGMLIDLARQVNDRPPAREMDMLLSTGEQVSVGDSLYLLEGETATLAATPGFVSYHWDPATGLSDPDAQAVVLTPPSTIFYTVFGTTDKGCVETDPARVKPRSTLGRG